MKEKKRSKGYAVAVGGAKGLVRILVYVLITLCIIYLGRTAYALGYKVFDEKPLADPEEAKAVSVTITEEMTVKEIGEMLKEKGLIEDSEVFRLQEMISDYHGDLKPGTYELTTAQPVDEMLAIMSRADVEDEEEES